MLTIPGYTLTELIAEGLNTVLYRGLRNVDDRPVVLKILKHDCPTLQEITRLRQEYQILQSLNLSSIVAAYGLEDYHNGSFLILEFGGQSLKSFTKATTLDLQEFLPIAIQLAQAVGELHQHKIIHKDIKPSNIIINPQTGQVKIADFGTASQLSAENPKISSPNSLEGTLAYMSPEQTGRMNRTIDYRTDFYSLGVTFYEILTGRLPFTTPDPMELVHCHIAVSPVPPLERGRTPQAVSDIVMKLLAKTAENRYQSAFGLKADLENCLGQQIASGSIRPFVLGQQDRAAQFHIPQKLYGREAELATLLNTFNRIADSSEREPTQNSKFKTQNSRSEMLLISGYSGIGKSSLVYEVHKPVVEARGYFISGKFDQLNRNIPYAALIQAFSELMRQLLTESEQQIKTWKAKLSNALGSNGQAIIDVIPEVELLVGPQPQVPQLGPTESQNRFNRVFQAFIQVFAHENHPLVLFLDDLQWADSASLKLIQLLMMSDSRYLLLIGAYRDNEISPTHPLMQTLEKMKSGGVVVNNIVLRPLSMTHVSQLLADSLGVEVTGLKPLINSLGSLLFHKTQGNPFFLTQLLKFLYEEELLRYDFGTGQWQWDIEEIQAIGIADKDIVELMAGSIQKLPEETQQVLKLAACIGNQFNLEVLSIVAQKSASDTAADLWPALQPGLILPSSNTYKIPLAFNSQELRSHLFSDRGVTYRFLHDQVQQAAYSLIPEPQKKQTHLQVGQLLLQSTSLEKRQENVFEIVNQLNIGQELLTQRSDLNELAALNLMAAIKAKAATAYELSIRYLTTGLELLAENSWQFQYELTLSLHVEAVEAEYLNNNCERAATLSEVVFEKATTLLDKVKVYEQKILFYIAQNQASLAIDTTMKVLQMLGLYLPKHPSKLRVMTAQLQTKLNFRGKRIEQLAELPRMTDPSKLAIMRLLVCVSHAAHLANPMLLPLLVFTMVNFSVKYGNSTQSIIGYGAYGLILCGVVGDIEAGYKFGQLSLKLLEQFDATDVRCQASFIFEAFVKIWKHYSKETLDPLVEAIQIGLENGNVKQLSYAAIIYCHHLFFTGRNLESIEQQQLQYLELVLKFKQEHAVLSIKLYRQMTLNLLNRERSRCQLVGESFDGAEMLPILQESNNLALLFDFYLVETILCYFFRDYMRAVETSRLAEKYKRAATATFGIAQHNFYNSLAQLAQYPHALKSEQKQYWQNVVKNQKQMQKWADNAPMNFQHKYELVEAEKARILGKEIQALDHYERAITGAKAQGYIQEEALANERAAEFHLSHGRERMAQAYLLSSYYGYIRWGAMAKVKALEERYPQLRSMTNTGLSNVEDTQTNTLALSSNNRSLDLTTAIKAAQTLDGEVALQSLLDKLMKIAIENAGAQQGFFLAKLENKWAIEAVATVEQSEIMLPSKLMVNSQIPVTVINYVERTRKTLVLESARQVNPFAYDPYIAANQTKSILCLPLIHQDRLTGMLYLENNLMEGAFSPERLEVLKIITSQVSIALENARLYRNLQAYTQELEAKNTALQQLEAREREKAKQLEQSLYKLQQTQSQLVQTEKISSLGQLVAGVAHEVNNPVSFISGNVRYASDYVQGLLNLVHLYQQEYPNPTPLIQAEIEAIELDYLIEDLPKILASMQVGTDRIRDIMQSLRNFSRVDEAQKSVDIHSALDSTLMILQHRLKATNKRPAIEVIKNYGNLPLVECYGGQLNQVFMNLLSNAIDALEEGEGASAPNPGVALLPRILGQDKAKGKGEDPNTPSIWIRTEVSSDLSYVVIRIADSGPGMTEEVQAKLFAPFFTTKPVGKGTGLGLSISYSIVVEKHGGQLKCASAPGEGTEFAIELPLASAPSALTESSSTSKRQTPK